MDSISLQICSFPHFHKGFLGHSSQDKAEYLPALDSLGQSGHSCQGSLARGEFVPKIRDHRGAFMFLMSSPHHRT